MKVLKPGDFGVGVRLAGVGHYLPANVMTNEMLVERGAPLTNDEMVRLSGISSRHYAADEEATSDLAIAACRQAMERAGMGPDGLDRLWLATVSPDHMSPSAACIVQAALGLKEAPAADLTASCSGFVYALDAAVRGIVTGEAASLICAADVRSRYLNLKDRATCALFGDGAAAAVLEKGPVGKGIVAVGLLADGTGAKSVYVPAGGSRMPASAESVSNDLHCIRMSEGPQVYLAAVEGMLATASRMLEAVGLSFKDIDLVVPHQPNQRILSRLGRLARLPNEKIFANIHHTGNVSGASVGLALEEALRTGRIQAGQKTLLVAAGAGYTAGAALLIPDEELVASFGFQSKS